MLTIYAIVLVVFGVVSGRVVRNDDCENRICTLEYMPWCNLETGHVYGNRCDKEIAECNAGTELPAVECFDVHCGYFEGDICTADYTPVCDLSGTEYGNPCTMAANICSETVTRFFMASCDDIHGE